MNKIARVSGIVLSASPVGEQDKRLVLQTCEMGRITAFAPLCRRAGSALGAAANPFVTGSFSLSIGRSSYRIIEANVKEYFRSLAALQPGVYMGFYFLDLIDYYGREGIDGTDMLNLLYVSLKALENEKIDDALIRRVFELRLMAINGDYAPDGERLSKGCYNICGYIAGAPVGKLYSFALSDAALKEVETESERAMRRVFDRELKSRNIMEKFYRNPSELHPAAAPPPSPNLGERSEEPIES